MKWRLFIACLILSSCGRAQLVEVPKRDIPEDNSLVSVPAIPTYSDEGFNLIVNEETGGRSVYNKWPYPEWPKGDSGITIAIGYDLSAVSQENIESDWSALNSKDINRLILVQPYSGSNAQKHLKDVSDILILWKIANDEFRTIDLVRFYLLTQKTFPGFDKLDPRCQFSLISLIFNRGNSMIGSSRTEMRQIRVLVNNNKIDYRAIADQFRLMTRIWIGTSIEKDMTSRRNHEADLIMKCLK